MSASAVCNAIPVCPAAEDEGADGGDPKARTDGDAGGGGALRAIAGAGGL